MFTLILSAFSQLLYCVFENFAKQEKCPMKNMDNAWERKCQAVCLIYCYKPYLLGQDPNPRHIAQTKTMFLHCAFFGAWPL